MLILDRIENFYFCLGAKFPPPTEGFKIYNLVAEVRRMMDLHLYGLDLWPSDVFLGVLKYGDMRVDLERERKTMPKNWAKRESQIEGLVMATMGMWRP